MTGENWTYIRNRKWKKGENNRYMTRKIKKYPIVQ